MATSTKTRVVLLLCALFPLAGCLQEDTITVMNDGLVKFESLVTITDEKQKTEFPVIEQGIAGMIGDLKQHKWKVEQVWTSKERPYRVKVTGSGKISEILGSTASYNLVKIADKTYRFSFVPVADSQIRVVFASPPGSARITDAAGKAVHEIESVSPRETFTIILK